MQRPSCKHSTSSSSGKVDPHPVPLSLHSDPHGSPRRNDAPVLLPGHALRLETITLAHVGILVVLAAWALGGNTETSRFALSCWGGCGVLITLLAAWRPIGDREQGSSLLRPLWPLAVFDLLVLVSLLNPSYRQLVDGAKTLYLEDRSLPHWSLLPSTARPDVSLNSLWFFNAAYLSCFNLTLTVVRRRALRILLLVVAANAVLLAVFGTLQKLMGAKALFFGAVKTPQPYFFASFIYHNHWGAFTLLMSAILLGLVFHFSQRRPGGFWRSPGTSCLVGVMLLAVTIPLSTSRSSSLLEALLLLGAFVYWLRSIIRRRLASARGVIAPVMLSLVLLFAAGAFVYNLASATIQARLSDTKTQLSEMRARGETMPRQILYRDTWNMARTKPWFGWGMGAYPTAFYHRNTQHDSMDGPVRLFHDAHSDWLQSVSEVGVVGTALLLLCAAVPLLSARRKVRISPLVACLFAGCSLVVLYAALEFPFGNRAVVIAFWLCFFAAVRYARLDASFERHV